MNPKSSPFGSIWRKWDLHFHTPTSYDYEHKGATNQEIIDGLIRAGVEVVAITDHHRIDTARIIELQKLGGANLTVLPGIEFRSELGGSDSVHYIGIFPENSDVVDLWTKLSGKLNITEAEVAKRGDETIYCPFVETSRVIHDLGGLLSVHAGKKTNTIEGLKNSDIIKQFVKKDLVRDHIDIYEVGVVADVQDYVEKVFPHLDRPIPLILCSDNHDIRDYKPKCPLWIKGDKSFEALRQTLFEPFRRVSVSVEKPIAPLLTIRNVVLDFPVDAALVGGNLTAKEPDPFCFRGKTEITFSPYLTCLIGGRGSGKSTLLNLIHEKLAPGSAKFFKTNSLSPEATTSIASGVSIDGDTEQKVVEFLPQNEIEQFATAPLGFTDAIFSRLAKRDADRKLSAMRTELLTAILNTNKQGKRLKEHHELVAQIVTAEKELASAKALIASFENAEYKAINSELGVLSKELKGLLNWRSRLETLINELGVLRENQKLPASINPNAYETEFFAILKEIEKMSAPVQARANLTAATERIDELSLSVLGLKYKLGDFLKGRGLSPENLADVGKANELVAQFEQELPSLQAKQSELASQITAYKSNRLELITKYSAIMSTLLEPLNQMLSQLGEEVRPIELRYEFDNMQFEQTMIKHIQEQLGEKAPRIDHICGMLEDVDFTALTDHEDFIPKLQKKQATAKLLHDHFSVPLNFALLQNEVEKKLLDVEAFGRVRVSYDGKPVESSSFGQRCTAAIVILLLLGNTPIVIDEPEAHLDSALIANYLVELIKTKKLDRQIIFATHNANFVVNGDAELIHVLEMGADKVTKIKSITIEDLTHREKLLALEGGSEAFLKREHRYGIG